MRKELTPKITSEIMLNKAIENSKIRRLFSRSPVTLSFESSFGNGDSGNKPE